MIGFDQEPKTEKGHPHEDPETRNLDKKELYTMLLHRFYLPPMQGKGVTREYLVKVFRNQVFRVPLLELKHFEVELTTNQTTRIGLANNSLLVRKINALLRSRGQPELGFDEFEAPDEVNTSDQTWLYRVARYIDQSNLLEFFESPVVQEDYSNAAKNPISRLYFGRLKASKYFFRIPEAKKDRKLWDNFRGISNQYRVYLAQRLLTDKLRADLDEANTKTTQIGRQLDDLISRAAFTYTGIENPQFRTDLLLQDINACPVETRNQVILNSKL